MSIQEATRPTPAEGRFDWDGPAPAVEPTADAHLTVHSVRRVDSGLARFVGVSAAVIVTLLATAALWALDAPVTVQLLAYVGVVVVLTMLIARMLPDQDPPRSGRRRSSPNHPSRR